MKEFSFRRLENIVRCVDCVSFDVFDTLLLRAVPKPSDVYEYVQAQYNHNNPEAPINNFVELRLNAEATAIQLRTSDSEEVLYDDIYSALKLDSQVKQQLKLFEIEAEKRLLIPNVEMVNFLNKCKATGKKITIISDMYLPREVIAEVLKETGIFYDKLFVSSECRVRKSTGHLYDYVLKDLHLSPKQMLHIGDNARSDYFMPKTRGIRSIRYKHPKNQSNAHIVENLSEKVLYGLSRASGVARGSYENIGYTALGPLLCGLSFWIHNNAEIADKAKVHFFSRDGYIISKAYEILFPDDEFSYTYVSRRSLTVPSLSDANCFSDILEKIPYIKRIETIRTLLSKMGIEDEQTIELCEDKYGSEIFRTDLLNGTYDALFVDIANIMKSIAKSEQCELEKYVYSTFTGNDIGVDIGWYGTIQKCLERQLRRTIPCYYLGLLRHNPDYNLTDAIGYAYDYRKGDHFDSSQIFSFNGLIETFFSAPHGSVKKYVSSHEAAHPVFEDVERENLEAIDGIHRGALSFVTNYSNLLPDYLRSNISPEAAYGALERILTLPTNNEVDLLGGLYFYDASYDKLCCFQGLGHYFFKPREFLYDFLKSNWKAGFLRKTFKNARIGVVMYTILSKLKGAK